METLENKIVAGPDKSTLNKCGVMYIATGKRFVNAAVRSARTVLKYCPGTNIHIFCDKENFDKLFALSNSPFTSISKITNPHVRSKVDYLALTPFEKTLYLDSDTIICDNIVDIFKVIENFDIALCHAHTRNASKNLETWNLEIPYAFPQYNGGVIAYRKNKKVLHLLDAWKKAYHAESFAKDQVTLRELLWLSDLHIATLPPEYNIRYKKYLFIWRRNEARPKILHLAKYTGQTFLRRNWKRLILKVKRLR